VDILLGVDLGTTNIKAIAYTIGGAILAEASRPTPIIPQGLRRACHDPEALWQEAMRAIHQVTTALSARAHVAGLAIASIGEAGVPLDAQGQALYPIIAWYDERTAPQAAWWAQHVGEAEVYRHTGLPLGHTFTLNKLMWLRDQEPGVYARLRKWLCVSDYIAYRLTGEQLMGYSLASRTMAFDPRSHAWSSEMLSVAGIEARCLPPPSPEGTPVGVVTVEAARLTGLSQGTPVFVGGHDHVCGALALGVYQPGIVLDSTGTTEAELVTLTDVESYLQAGNLSFCLGCHVAHARYYAIGSILGAGSMLSWLASLLWPMPQGASHEESLQALTEAASASPLGARGLYILPHLAGAGSPERCSTARGVFAGLSLEHSRSDLARATLEGLAYELRFLWEALEGFARHPIERVMAAGGGARNALWSQIKANVTGRPFFIPEHTESVTLGAAVLAGLGAGIYRDEDDAHSQVRLSIREVRPIAEESDAYDRFYRHFTQQLRPLAADLGRKSGTLDQVR
jgi:xylulokinase